MSPSHLGGVVRDFRVLRYEPDAKTRLVHGRRTRGVQEPGAPEQHGALAAVGRHLGDGQLVGHQTLYGAVDLTAARFAVAARNADAKVRTVVRESANETRPLRSESGETYEKVADSREIERRSVEFYVLLSVR